jgi:hypothetical protein
MFPMRKIMLTLLLVAVTATSAGAYFVSKNGAGSSLTARASSAQIVAEITKCTGDQWDNYRLNSETVVECVTEQVLRPQVAKGNITNLNLALEDVVSAHREFWLPCHNIMHRAADDAAKTPSGILTLIEMIDLPSCQGGLVHGLIDAFARVSPTQQDFQSLGDTCSKFNDLSQAQTDRQRMEDFHLLYAYCTDGAGHAAWEHAHDLSSAVDACNALNEPTGQAACAEGVLMQIYEPANGAAEKSVEQGFTDIPELCANWPDKTDEKATLIGCNTGAAYVYTRPAWRIAWQINSSPDASQGGESQEELLAKAEQHIKRAIDMCVKYHTSDCLRSLANQVPDVLYGNQATIDDICASTLENKEMCLQAKSARAGKK